MPLSNFMNSKQHKYKHTYKNFYSHEEYAKAYHEAVRRSRPEMAKQWDLNKYFHINVSEYNELLKSQQNKWAICRKKEIAVHWGKVKALSIDHCHKTGKIRGLLCYLCNTGLGKFRESPNLLRKAANYVSAL